MPATEFWTVFDAYQNEQNGLIEAHFKRDA